MKAIVCLGLLFALLAKAAETAPTARNQIGRMSTVQLLATGRVTQGAPDGMRFLFLVTPTAGTLGAPTLKETRDFLIEGQSYQERSQSELGRRLEPETLVDNAAGFFAKQPGARRLAPEKIDGAKIISINIGGAKLETGTRGQVSVSFGFNKEVEPFTFAFTVPPAPSETKVVSRAESGTGMAGTPPAPADGRIRFVATEGVSFAPWTFDLALTGSTVSGAIYQHRTDGKGMVTGMIGPFEIYEGKIEGQRITFKAQAPGGGRVASFVGEMSNDEIRFTRSIELTPGSFPRGNGILGRQGATEFVAKRAM